MENKQFQYVQIGSNGTVIGHSWLCGKVDNASMILIEDGGLPPIGSGYNSVTKKFTGVPLAKEKEGFNTIIEWNKEQLKFDVAYEPAPMPFEQAQALLLAKSIGVCISAEQEKAAQKAILCAAKIDGDA